MIKKDLILNLYQLSLFLKVNQAYEYFNLLGGDKLDTNFEKYEQNSNEKEKIEEETI